MFDVDCVHTAVIIYRETFYLYFYHGPVSCNDEKKKNIFTFIHSVLFPLRIVPITGVSQLGWHTTSTTLFIHLHVSQPKYTHTHTHTHTHTRTHNAVFCLLCSHSTPAYLSSQHMEKYKLTMRWSCLWYVCWCSLTSNINLV